MTDRKRRADSWDSALTEAQRWEAYEKAKGLSWTAFAAFAAAEYGVRPGKNAIYDWLAHMRRQEGAHRLERAIAARKELQGLADAVQINAASLRLQEQRQNARRLKLQEEALALQREKFEAAEKRLNAATEAAQDATLTEAERLAKIRSIFGLP